METFLFSIIIIGFVYGCSLFYDNCIGIVRRRLRGKARGFQESSVTAFPASPEWLLKCQASLDDGIARGYDSPELYYQDTLARIQLAGVTGKSPASVQ